jgi:hypothetical protein
MGAGGMAESVWMCERQQPTAPGRTRQVRIRDGPPISTASPLGVGCWALSVSIVVDNDWDKDYDNDGGPVDDCGRANLISGHSGIVATGAALFGLRAGR